MTPEIADILLNKEVIAVDQDAEGMQGTLLKKDGDREVWARQLGDGSEAVVLFNRSGAAVEMTVRWNDLDKKFGGEAKVRDLWAHRELGVLKGGYSATVPSHGVAMIRVQGTQQ